jgi:hypothetical protein
VAGTCVRKKPSKLVLQLRVRGRVATQQLSEIPGRDDHRPMKRPVIVTVGEEATIPNRQVYDFTQELPKFIMEWWICSSRNVKITASVLLQTIVYLPSIVIVTYGDFANAELPAEKYEKVGPAGIKRQPHCLLVQLRSFASKLRSRAKVSGQNPSWGVLPGDKGGHSRRETE